MAKPARPSRTARAVRADMTTGAAAEAGAGPDDKIEAVVDVDPLRTGADEPEAYDVCGETEEPDVDCA